MPRISVIMPVYNTEKYLKEAIESILNQTFYDFEFIIIDDCSTDKGYELLEEYEKRDSRIRLYKNKKNMGISFTRNRLIGFTTTNYIASQDSDDISMSDRLQKSIDFLDNNKYYGVVSGNIQIIDEDSRVIGFRKYSNDIKNIILKKSPIAQPSSMFRKDAFYKVGGYDNTVRFGLEDYDLWLRFFSNGYLIENINNTLLKYRIRKGQCKSNVKAVLRATISIQYKAIRKYGLIPNRGDLFYIFLEKLLYFLPSKIIFSLFKLIEYRGIKK